VCFLERNLFAIVASPRQTSNPAAGLDARPRLGLVYDPRMSSRSSRVELLIAALLFSTGGVAIKAIALTNWQVVCGRSLLAALVIAAGGRGLWRGFSWRSALVGAAQAATLITFVTANKLTTAANAVFLQATAPLYIALLGPSLLGEHIKRRDIPLLALIFAGVLLLFAGSQEPLATAPHRVLGTIVGVVSGFCWSLTVMGLRWMARTVHEDGSGAARAAAVTGSLIAFLVCVPAAFPLPAPRAGDLLAVAYLGVFQAGAAYLLLSRGLRHVPAAAASLLLLVEPALSPIWAWLVHHESPGFWPLVGGALIIGAATAATWRDTRVPVLE
jgi:drug/metabolite transporter (DMT)-like permease